LRLLPRPSEGRLEVWGARAKEVLVDAETLFPVMVAGLDCDLVEPSVPSKQNLITDDRLGQSVLT
jgi:hypothetical protein